jgi:hypothetical protein
MHGTATSGFYAINTSNGRSQNDRFSEWARFSSQLLTGLMVPIPLAIIHHTCQDKLDRHLGMAFYFLSTKAIALW